VTAALAGPPTALRVRAKAKSIKNFPAPDLSRKAPKMINMMTYFTMKAVAMP
jgi:hypothetical protein